jgi:hypothetical protein
MQPAIQPDFLSQLASDMNLPKVTVQVLSASGARSPEAILSLLQSFPNLATNGYVESNVLSNEVVKRAGPALQKILAATHAGWQPGPSRHSKQGGYGAAPPPGARWRLRDTVPPPGVRLAAPAPVAVPPPGLIDLRGCPPWPVRDQGQRGTCVAFSTTALREQLLCETEGALHDLSEQFLYWDIKTNSPDPNKTSDGTWIEFAFDSLNRAGICPEAIWPYNPNPLNGNAAQGPAPAGAVAAAQALRYSAALYSRITTSSGNAAKVLNALQTARRPVAISLPVFSDPLMPQTNNWETPVAWQFGYVLDPPATSTVSDGHCVCVTGFSPDPNEPTGGYFVIRNSWSGRWGALLPSAGYAGPEPGYGQVSASYVDKFLWEFGQL